MYLDHFPVLRAISEFIKYLAFFENLAIYQIFRLGRSTLKSQIQPVIQLFRVISPKLLDSKFGRIYSEYPNDSSGLSTTLRVVELFLVQIVGMGRAKFHIMGL